MIKVSVIVPVYNAEKYLARCLDSLLRQTVSCEFLVVNDGSNDRSREIIESYRKQDKRIVLIDQQNQGVSAARNAGISMARGEYLGFVDADDYIESDMYAQLSAAGDSFQSDIVISNLYYEQGGTKAVSRFEFPKETVLNKTFIERHIFPFFVKKETLNSACNKIFRRDFIAGNAIRFPEKVALGEDAVFNMRAFAKCQRAVYLDYSGYHYLEVAGSATRNVAETNYFQRVLDAYNFDYKAVLPIKADEDQYRGMKAEKFISSVLSLVHLYFNASGIGLNRKFQLVGSMIEDPKVQEILNASYENVLTSRDRYSRFLLKCIKNRQLYRLYLAVCYSRLRN